VEGWGLFWNLMARKDHLLLLYTTNNLIFIFEITFGSTLHPNHFEIVPSGSMGGKTVF
jgi:hypothetical protein